MYNFLLMLKTESLLNLVSIVNIWLYNMRKRKIYKICSFYFSQRVCFTFLFWKKNPSLKVKCVRNYKTKQKKNCVTTFVFLISFLSLMKTWTENANTFISVVIWKWFDPKSIFLFLYIKKSDHSSLQDYYSDCFSCYFLQYFIHVKEVRYKNQ